MKLLIVADHPILRDGLSLLLERANISSNVVQAESPSRGLAELDIHPDLDLVIFDLTMPSAAGAAEIVKYREKRPALPVIVLAPTGDPGDVRRLTEAGALGYVPKTLDYQALQDAVKLVLSGERYVPLESV